MSASRCAVNTKACDTLNARLGEARALLTPTPGQPLGDTEKAVRILIDAHAVAKTHKIRHLVAHGYMTTHRELSVSLSVHLRGVAPAAMTTSLISTVRALVDLVSSIFHLVEPSRGQAWDAAGADEDFRALRNAGFLDTCVALSYCVTRIPLDCSYVSLLSVILSREARGHPDRGVCQAIIDLFSVTDYSYDAPAVVPGTPRPWEVLAKLVVDILSSQRHATNPAVIKMASFLVRHSAQVPETELTTLTRFVDGLAHHYYGRNAVPPEDFAGFGTVMRLATLTMEVASKDAAFLLLVYVETANQKYRGQRGLIPGKWGLEMAQLAIRHRLEPAMRRRVTNKSEREDAMVLLLNMCIVRCYQSQRLLDYLSTPPMLKIILENCDEYAAICMTRLLARSENALAFFTEAKGHAWVIQRAMFRKEAESEGYQLVDDMPHFDSGKNLLRILVEKVHYGSLKAVEKSTYVRDLLRTHLSSQYDAHPDDGEWNPELRTWADVAMIIDFMAQSDEGCRTIVAPQNDLQLRIVGMVQGALARLNDMGVLKRDGAPPDVVTAFRHAMSSLISTTLAIPTSTAVPALTRGFGECNGATQTTFVEFIVGVCPSIAQWAGTIEPMFEAWYAVALILQAASTRRAVPASTIEKFVLFIGTHFAGNLLSVDETEWPCTFYNGMLCLSILYEYFPELMNNVDMSDVTSVGWHDFVELYTQRVLDHPDTSSDVSRLARDVRKEIKLLKRGTSAGIRTHF